MDEYAIASALATRLGATTPPSGQEAIKLASADFPDGLTLLPALIVGLSEMEAESFSSGMRSLTLDFPVTFFLSRADGTPRRSRALRDWITALYPRLSGYMTLGALAYVSWAEIVAWETGVVRYGEDFDGGVLTARVLVREASGAAA
jgi:hypothetical protein